MRSQSISCRGAGEVREMGKEGLFVLELLELRRPLPEGSRYCPACGTVVPQAALRRSPEHAGSQGPQGATAGMDARTRRLDGRRRDAAARLDYPLPAGRPRRAGLPLRAGRPRATGGASAGMAAACLCGAARPYRRLLVRAAAWRSSWTGSVLHHRWPRGLGRLWGLLGRASSMPAAGSGRSFWSAIVGWLIGWLY